MRILVSNDDGFHAEGIQVLATELRKIAEVIDAALRLRSGATTDCVHLALNGFLSGQVDLVVSGINAGCNMGDDTIYSGTLAAALEGRHLGLPAIAVSLDGRQHYETAARVVCDLIPKLHHQLLNPREIININVPDLPFEELNGYKVCRLGYRASSAEVIKQRDPRDDTRGKIAISITDWRWRIRGTS